MTSSEGLFPTEQEVRAETNPSRKAVLAAMLRITEGRSEQNMSVAGLAREAGIDRAKLTTGAVKDLGERMKAIAAAKDEAQTPREAALMAEVAKQKAAADEAKVAAKEAKQEAQGWRDTADTLALTVAALHSDLKKAETRIDMLNKQLKSQAERFKELQGGAAGKAGIRLIGR
jgi:hypothetical protein